MSIFSLFPACLSLFSNHNTMFINILKDGHHSLKVLESETFFLPSNSILPKSKIKYLHSESTDHPIAIMQRGDIHFQGETWSYSLFFHLHFNGKTFHSVPSEKPLYAFKWRFFFPLSLRMMTQMLEALLSCSEWAGTTRSHLIELWRPLIPVYKMPDTHHSSLFHTHTALPAPVPFWLTILKNSSMVSSLLLFKMKLLPGERAECENQTYSPAEDVSTELDTSCVYTCLFLIWCFWNYFASRSPSSINCWRFGRCIRREEMKNK